MTTHTRDEELGAALRALETPEHRPGFEADLRRRLEELSAVRARRGRYVGLSRPRAVAIAVAAAVAVVVPAAVLGVQGLGSDAPRDWSAAVGDLPALAPGEPKPSSPAAGTSLMVQVTRAQLVSDAERVFVGTVVAEGGSEFVDPPFENPDFIRGTAHRVRFAVDDTFRGEETDVLDLLIPDGAMEFGDFEVGQHVLVFAETRELGELRVPGLMPLGYWQGVFRVGDDGTARNEATDLAFSLDELEAELQR
jgi:hypothetical protein